MAMRGRMGSPRAKVNQQPPPDAEAPGINQNWHSFPGAYPYSHPVLGFPWDPWSLAISPYYLRLLEGPGSGVLGLPPSFFSLRAQVSRLSRALVWESFLLCPPSLCSHDDREQSEGLVSEEQACLLPPHTQQEHPSGAGPDT